MIDAPTTAGRRARRRGARGRAAHRILGYRRRHLLQPDGRLETDKLARLQRVCKLTQSRVCLSSDWRRHVSARNHVRKTLNALGIKMIGMTPIGAPWARPREITAWLTSFNQRQVAEGKAECRAWVAVDDRLLLEEPGGEKLHGHFVRTMPHRGLTDEKASMMCAMLLKSDGEGAAAPQPASPEAEELAFGLGAGGGGARAARPLSVHGTLATGGPRRNSSRSAPSRRRSRSAPWPPRGSDRRCRSARRPGSGRPARRGRAPGTHPRELRPLPAATPPRRRAKLERRPRPDRRRATAAGRLAARRHSGPARERRG